MNLRRPSQKERAAIQSGGSGTSSTKSNEILMQTAVVGVYYTELRIFILPLISYYKKGHLNSLDSMSLSSSLEHLKSKPAEIIKSIFKMKIGSPDGCARHLSGFS